MHAEVRVLADAVVEAVWAPAVREEHERDRLPEVVQLQAARAYRVHDRRVVHDPRGDAERAGAEHDVRVRRRARTGCKSVMETGRQGWKRGRGSPVGVADDEERDVFGVSVAEDLVRFGLYHVAVGEDQLLPVECFLAHYVSGVTE